jgi:hypothetical protein
MCTHYLHHFHTPPSFPHLFHPWVVPHPPVSDFI